jgi:hypothetical protein
MGRLGLVSGAGFWWGMGVGVGGGPFGNDMGVFGSARREQALGKWK